MKRPLHLVIALAAFGVVTMNSPIVRALDYPYAPYNEGKMDPQLTGWPLTEAEQKYVTIEEYSRKPGHELQKHLPEMWPVTPSAALWGEITNGDGDSWLTRHATLVKNVQACKGEFDIMLIGDSITQGWAGEFNAVWQSNFGKYKTLNAGIGGDRTENVLWRLEHGAVDGAKPKAVVLLIGVNNAQLVSSCGVPAKSVAQGIKLCVNSIRAKCPGANVVLVKILPAYEPGEAAYEDIKGINVALDELKNDGDSKVHVLDMWSDFANADGSRKPALYSDGCLHLNSDGYQVYAGKLKPLVEILLGTDNGTVASK